MANPSGDRDKLREEIVKQARELYLDVRFNCAESIIVAVDRGLELGVPPQVLRSTTPLGGGIGLSGETCGALVAGAMILGLLYGRTDANEDKTRAYEAGKAYRDRFEQANGGTLCRDINFMDFTGPDHRPRCSKVVSTAAGLLFDLIEERDRTS